MSEKNSNEKGMSEEVVSKEDLRDSARQTNKRIDNLDVHMIAMVDKMGTLIETQIRAEERDNRNTETLIRLEKNQIDIGKRLKNYETNNDERMAVLEKQVLLLEIDDKSEKDAKNRANKNKDARKNTVLAALTIALILASLKIIGPYL